MIVKAVGEDEIAVGLLGVISATGVFSNKILPFTLS